jgi:hypothetical protein
LLADPKTLQGDDIMPDEEQRDLDLGLIRPKASVSISLSRVYLLLFVLMIHTTSGTTRRFLAESI